MTVAASPPSSNVAAFPLPETSKVHPVVPPEKSSFAKVSEAKDENKIIWPTIRHIIARISNTLVRPMSFTFSELSHPR